MSKSPPPRILIDNVQVDHSNTVVHGKKKKETFVPPWAQAKLKSGAPATSRDGGSKVRTFKGGTIMTVTKGGGNKSKVETPSPKNTNTANRLAQPHDKQQVAPAPVAYVPEQRLYKKKLDDKAFLNRKEPADGTAKATTATPAVAAAASPPPAASAPAPAPPEAAASDDWWNQGSADLELEAKILNEIDC